MQCQWNVLNHYYLAPYYLFQVSVSADAPVGIWKCKVETSFKGESGVTIDRAVYTHPEPVYILFNPTSKRKQYEMFEFLIVSLERINIPKYEVQIKPN